mmetsp:Transcript_14184/g.17574  ORF Transcript_14184/g.17574 Transcript_14184/m.17574 type:complete len:202 (-) Transcript_14184:79-684(-)
MKQAHKKSKDSIISHTCVPYFITCSRVCSLTTFSAGSQLSTFVIILTTISSKSPSSPTTTASTAATTANSSTTSSSSAAAKSSTASSSSATPSTSASTTSASTASSTSSSSTAFLFSSESGNRKNFLWTYIHFVILFKRRCYNTVISFYCKHYSVNRSENFINFSNFRFILEIYWCIEIWYFVTQRRVANHILLGSMREYT